jgi:hypothetical protein
MTSTADADEPTLKERAEHLKERIYVTFAALAVVLTLRSHVEETSAGDAARTLTIAVLGTLLAVFVADLVSHLVVHAHVPTTREMRHMLRVSFGAFSAIVLPLIFVGLAGLDVWGLDTALQASTIALVAALGVIGWIAVRRVRMPTWQKLVVLLAEVVLGFAVVGLELLAHG